MITVSVLPWTLSIGKWLLCFWSKQSVPVNMILLAMLRMKGILTLLLGLLLDVHGVVHEARLLVAHVSHVELLRMDGLQIHAHHSLPRSMRLGAAAGLCEHPKSHVWLVGQLPRPWALFHAALMRVNVTRPEKQSGLHIKPTGRVICPGNSGESLDHDSLQLIMGRRDRGVKTLGHGVH